MALIPVGQHAAAWLCGTLQMAWAERKSSESAPLLVLRAVREIARNPIMLALGVGFLWRLTGLGLHPVADKDAGAAGAGGLAHGADRARHQSVRIQDQRPGSRDGRDVRAQAAGDARPSPRSLRSTSWRCRRFPRPWLCCLPRCRPAPMPTSSRPSTDG
jgi:hypothetical protein